MTKQEPELDAVVALLLNKINDIGFDLFQEAIALGRWPDGTAMSEIEKPAAMQAILVYEHRHVPLEKRTGFIFKGQCQSKE